MTDERTGIDWTFWLQWVAAGMVGFVVSLVASGFVLGFTAFWRVWDDHYYGSTSSPEGVVIFCMFIGIVSAVIIGPVAGAVLGVLQWLALRQRVSEAGGWIGASTAGLVVGLIGSSIWLVVAMPRSDGNIITVPGEVLVPMFGAVIGAAVGIMQWRVLRRQVSRAGWWVLASTVGGAVTVVVTFLLLMVSGEVQFSMSVVGAIVSMLVGGVVYGAITGAALVWLLQHSKPRLPRTDARSWPLVVGLGAVLGPVVLVACLAVLAERWTSGLLTPTPLPLPTPYQGSLPLHITGQDGKEMVLVPAGEFLMGSKDTDSVVTLDTSHFVTLDAFYIDRTEVANAEFCRFLNEQGNQSEGDVTWLDIDDEGCRIVYSGGQYRPKDGYTDHPVVEVTWYGARAYAQWAGKRLPTEAEWEKAARGPDGRIYPWGNTWDPARANMGKREPGQTSPVGSYPSGASPYGVLNMAGNVREWTSSVYDERLDHRVVRGSSWFYSQSEFARCSYRSGTLTQVAGPTIGFRCVRAADVLETTP